MWIPIDLFYGADRIACSKSPIRQPERVGAEISVTSQLVENSPIKH